MASPSSLLQNVYYERKVGTAKPCYICRRPTTTVLATLKMEDYLYTCDGHLTDPATLIPAPAAPAGPTSEGIKKVVADYHAREAKKATVNANPNDSDEKADQDKEKDTNKDKGGKEKEKEKGAGAGAATPTIPLTSTPPTPTHKKYALHRAMFDMRRHELRRREQGVKAKEVSKGMPQVPRTAF